MDDVNELQTLWGRTDWLFGLVPTDRWRQRGIELRHPFLFYVGHLPAFAWNHVRTAIGAEAHDSAPGPAVRPGHRSGVAVGGRRPPARGLARGRRGDSPIGTRFASG